MVTKLKSNEEYILYVRKKITENLPKWKELTAKFEGQPNNNFVISFRKETDKVEFIKDRGLLEMKIYLDDKMIDTNELYGLIGENVVGQSPNWPLSICKELIDFYVSYLRNHYYNV
jgi:hypothetical protein